ncbi:MAG: sulfatase-like hydrolase/transferase, partial [Rhodospirillales bacterium]
PHETGYWDNCFAYDGKRTSWMHRLRGQGHEVVSVGKLHFRSADDDNGFSEEIIPMHIVGGIGALSGLLRAVDREPERIEHGQMYMESGEGMTPYQEYDFDITEKAIRWLRNHAKASNKPWVLVVSYPTPHPAFLVPKRLLDLYDPKRMPLPVRYRLEDKPMHPSVECAREKYGIPDMPSDDRLREIAAAYCALITHTDEQIGKVLKAAEELGLLETTRVLYTSDHGEAIGNHGLFGKWTLYEHSAAIPLIVTGADIPAAHVVTQPGSHVDLFPTLVESVGAELAPEDETLPGRSLWPAIGGTEAARPVFAEYHSSGSRNGAFMVRDGDWKLIYHANEPAQLFDLASDPREIRDLIEDGQGAERAAVLEAKLRTIVDPEAADRQAKADQLARAERHGGVESIADQGYFTHTPTPGQSAEMHA